MLLMRAGDRPRTPVEWVVGKYRDLLGSDDCLGVQMSKLVAIAVAVTIGTAAGLLTTAFVPAYAQQQEKCYKFCQQRCAAANRKSDCEGACISKCMASGQGQKKKPN